MAGNHSVRMNIYKDLLRWATEQDVEINGIEPQILSGKGTGIIATRDIEVSNPSITLRFLLTAKGRRNHSCCPVQNFSDSKACPKSHLTKAAPTYITPRPPSCISHPRQNTLFRFAK